MFKVTNSEPVLKPTCIQVQSSWSFHYISGWKTTAHGSNPAHCLVLNGPQGENKWYLQMNICNRFDEREHYSLNPIKQNVIPKIRMLFFLWVDLYYQKKNVLSYYIFNFVNKKLVDIYFFSCYRITYVISLILLLGLQSLNYQLTLSRKNY